MSKFDDLYNKIILEMSASDRRTASDQDVIQHTIEDEFIENGFKLKDGWENYLPSMQEYILDELESNDKYEENETIMSIDYIDLIDLVKHALDDHNLIIYVEDEDNKN